MLKQAAASVDADAIIAAIKNLDTTESETPFIFASGIVDMLPRQLNISSKSLGRVLSQLVWLPMGKVEKACRLPIWRHQQCGRYVYGVNNQYIESPEKKRRSSGGATQCACSSFTQHDKNCNLGEWSPPCDAHHFPEYGVPRVSPSAAATPAAAATRGGCNGSIDCTDVCS